MVGDAKATLADLLQSLNALAKPADFKNSPYFARIQELKAEWQQALAPMRD